MAIAAAVVAAVLLPVVPPGIPVLFAAVVGLMTVALLSALIVVQALGSGTSIQVDARVPAVGVTALLLRARAPFIVVVVAAAATAAAVRAFV